MKKIITTIPVMIFLMITMSLPAIYAASFTAVSSGNWSSAATWGGTAPSNNINSDQITIPTGITVTMDNSTTFSGALSSLTVNGTLASSTDATLTMNIGSIIGTGTVMVDHVVMNSASTLTFTGTFAVRTMRTSVGSLLTTAHYMIGESVTFSAGLMTIQSGGLFDMDSNSTIVMAGGTFVISGGTTSLGKPYQVQYNSSSVNAGAELTGSGLNHIDVDCGSGNSVMLQSDLTTNAGMRFGSGELSLNGHNLTLNGGDIDASGTGSIYATSASSITINRQGAPAGAIRFSSNGHTLNNFTLTMTETGGSAMLGSDLNITGTLHLGGGSIHTGDYNLDLGTTGKITGWGSNSYVKLGVMGRLTMYVTPGSPDNSDYPVGTPDRYTPCFLKIPNGNTGRSIGVGLEGDVWSQGSTGSSLSSSQPIVKNTWHLFTQNSTDLNLSMQVLWSASMESNNFNRSQCYLSHYLNGKWDVNASASATVESGGMYSIKRDNITSLSPFAVFDTKTTDVAELNNSNPDFMVSPNPSSDYIRISGLGNINEPVKMTIRDMLGQVVQSMDITVDNAIVPIEQLKNGYYFISVNFNEAGVMKKIVKL